MCSFSFKWYNVAFIICLYNWLEGFSLNLYNSLIYTEHTLSLQMWTSVNKCWTVNSDVILRNSKRHQQKDPKRFLMIEMHVWILFAGGWEALVLALHAVISSCSTKNKRAAERPWLLPLQLFSQWEGTSETPSSSSTPQTQFTSQVSMQ